MAEIAERYTEAHHPRPDDDSEGSSQEGSPRRTDRKFSNQMKEPVRRCFICNSTKHLARECARKIPVAESGVRRSWIFGTGEPEAVEEAEQQNELSKYKAVCFIATFPVDCGRLRRHGFWNVGVFGRTTERLSHTIFLCSQMTRRTFNTKMLPGLAQANAHITMHQLSRPPTPEGLRRVVERWNRAGSERDADRRPVGAGIPPD